MYLHELLIINYKSCQNVQIRLEKDYPNVLIGINDCGKSTILQSIGLLLDLKPKFNYSTQDKLKDDLSNTKITEADYEKVFQDRNLPVLPFNPNNCIIAGSFVLEDSDINDSNREILSNHLLWVAEKSDNNPLWLARSFDLNDQKHTDYLLTNDDSNEPQNLFLANQTTLNKWRKKLEISGEEIENENRLGRYKNIELVKAIYAHLDLGLCWAQYKVDKEFWPQYRYLDWNISMEQLTQFVNDTISSKIERPMNYASRFALRQANKAQDILNDELERFTDMVTTDLPHITRLKANINFQVNTKVTDILVNKSNADGDIHLDSQGDGIKRQLWFALIKWSALNSIEQGMTDKKYIWGFDEPETHLYPKAQRDFFEVIKEVSKTNIQSILSTHSTIFIDRARFDIIKKVDLVNGYTSLSNCEAVEDIFSSLQLKNSDFLFFDKFFVVEGDTEQYLIPHLYKVCTGRTLHQDNMQLVNLGGKDKRFQNQQILTAILTGFKKDTESSTVYLFDNDAKSSFTRVERERMKHYFFIGNQDIEDSIDSTVWHELISSKLGEKIVLSVDDIEHLKASIPIADDSTKLPANQKFYPQLIRLLREKLRENGLDPHEVQVVLPSKGSDSGKLLAQYINDQRVIDNTIKSAFNVLRH